MKNLVRSVALATLMTVLFAGFFSPGGGVPHPVGTAGR
jgi:hypothetical protein